MAADAAFPAERGTTVGELVQAMTQGLAPAFAGDARREARELLAALHDMPRHWPAVEGAAAVTAAAWDAAMMAAARRATGAPMQYAAGRAAFRHLVLDVDERVLIPRPETELLVDIVLEMVGGAQGGVAADVGTGSGAIALALASEGSFARVIGTDVSLDALTVARRNAERCADSLVATVELRHGSFLAPVPERGLRAVVSNPPYIAHEEGAALPAAVRDWEPSVALFSAGEGMAVTARLVREAAERLAPGGVLALETDTRRAAALADATAAHGAYRDVRVLLDLTGRERFVVARRLGEER